MNNLTRWSGGGADSAPPLKTSTAMGSAWATALTANRGHRAGQQGM